MPPPALEVPEADLDGQLPFVRPLPHVAVLQDELPHLFQDDYVGAQEEAAAVEARGEHTLLEKFGAGRPSRGGSAVGDGGPAATRPGVSFAQCGGGGGVAEPGRTTWALTSVCRSAPSVPGRLLRPGLQSHL